MERIIATGTLYGRKATVTLTKTKDTLEFAIDDKLIEEPAKIRFACSQDFLEPIDDVYLFPKNTLQSGYRALHNNFFDDNNFVVTVEGTLEKIPFKQSFIY